MRSALKVGLLVLLPLSTARVAADTTEISCYPPPDPEMPQYSVGYGSLMEKASKERTAPATGYNRPALITGFQRAWNARGSKTGFSTTYLGVRPDADAEMAATVYSVLEVGDILATDEREAHYCRMRVSPDQIRMLDGSDVPDDGEFWIYVNRPDAVKPPSARYPIVQSYVDIFITGCLQLSELAVGYDGDFADACIETTAGWSEHWVNDRIHPRRPFIDQPNASRIDSLLYRLVPEAQSITIE
jgi:hypothetical protein